MAQELYILKGNSEVLTEPRTPITDFTVSINHMGDNRLSAKFYYPKKIDFDLTEYVVYKKEGEYNVFFRGIYDDSIEYHANDVVLHNGVFYITISTIIGQIPPSGDWTFFYPDAETGALDSEIYYLFEPPVFVKDEKSLMLEYNCEFAAKSEVLKYIPMIDSWESLGDGNAPKRPFLYQTEYSFFGGVVEYFENIKSSMIAEFGGEPFAGGIQPKGWRMFCSLGSGYEQEGENQIIEVSNKTVFESLQDIYQRFKVPFFVSNNIIVVGGIKRYVEHRFRYGKGNGLYKLTKSKLNDDIITKIRGVGSERNIPYGYLQAEKAAAGLSNTPMARLMPFVFRETLASAALDPQLLTDVRDYYVSEKHNEAFPRVSFETLDEIYPTIKQAEYNGRRIDKIVGVYFNASSVNDENATNIKDDKEEIVNPRFWIKIPALGFDLRECLNEKDKLVLSPVSGYCGGCRFNVLSIGSQPRRWQGFRNLYRSDAMSMIMLDIKQEIAAPAESVMVYETNTVELGHLDRIDFNFTGTIKISNQTNPFSGAVIAIHLIKDDSYFETLATIDYEPQGTGNYTYNINEPGDYTLYDVETAGLFKIRIIATLYIEGNSRNVSLDMPLSVSTITPRVSYNEMNDTTNESQWLLVQKDIETYNTLMPLPVNPMWTVYSSPEDWNTDVYHKNPVGLVPQIDDEYVFLGITLPESYIVEAEKRLENALLDILEKNDEFKFTYECGFDEKMLIENPSINSDIQIGRVIRVYDGTDPKKYVPEDEFEEVVINSLVLKYTGDKTLPSKSN